MNDFVSLVLAAGLLKHVLDKLQRFIGNFTTPGSRIVGGTRARIEDFPYQLSLQVRGHHICGASVLTSYAAITAAHCVQGAHASQLNVYAGSASLNYGGITRNVRTYVIHHKYNNFTMDYDIAVLKVGIKLCEILKL
ncbi:Serine protease [Rhyzopertha dominica]|nr:Serine protease [Rhyzopertha dominica]